MNNIAIGYITMNAGDDIPGSILKWAVKKFHSEFDYIVVVDGNLTKEAMAFYETIPNIRVVDSPWDHTNNHVAQYLARTSATEEGDWLLAMDDDEAPTDELVQFIQKNLRNIGNINMVHIPAVTYICKNNSNFYYRAQEWPRGEQRCIKRILYKVSKSIAYIRSQCGMHVTPTVVDTNGNIAERGITSVYAHYHFKSLESFMLNDSIYIVADPRPRGEDPSSRGFTEQDVCDLEAIVDKYGLRNRQLFLDITKNNSWPKELVDFALRFKDHVYPSGKACSRLYVLYFLLQRALPAPIEYTYDQIFEGWSTELYDIYRHSLGYETPIDIKHTPTFWKKISLLKRGYSET